MHHHQYQSQRSQTLTNELYRLYDRLGKLIEQETHETQPQNIKVSLDLPSTLAHRYRVNVNDQKYNQCHYNNHCCHHYRPQPKIQEMVFQQPQPKQTRYKFDVVDTSNSYTVKDYRQQSFASPARQEKSQSPIVIHQKLIQTDAIQEEPPIITQSIEIQTEQPKPEVPASPKQTTQSYNPKIRQYTDTSQIMIEHLNSNLKNEYEWQKKDIQKRRDDLTLKLRNNLQRVDNLSHSTRRKKGEFNQKKCIFEGCKCKGMYQQAIKRSLTPTFNSARYSPTRIEYEPYRTYERRMQEESRQSKTHLKNLNSYIKNVRHKYVLKNDDSYIREQREKMRKEASRDRRQVKSASPIRPYNRHMDVCLNMAKQYTRS